MKVSVVIPARWRSVRLPGKMLADLHGKPVLWHTWERAKRINRYDELVVVTDYEGIYDEVKQWGGNVLMTDEKCQSGTERVASIINQLKGDLILLVQGDECFIDVELLNRMIKEWERRPCDILTPVTSIKNEVTLMNPNMVKVVIAEDGRALYFSRLPVPYIRGGGGTEDGLHWQHIGVYGYKRSVLENFFNLKPSRLEMAERLEQLRFLESHYTIMTIEAKENSLEINTLEDLELARKSQLKVTV